MTLPDTEPGEASEQIHVTEQPPPASRGAAVGQVAVQVLAVRGQRRRHDGQDEGNDAAHRQHRESVIGVGPHEVAPPQGGEPPQPVGTAALGVLVSGHPHTEGECEHDHGQAPSLTDLPSQLGGHRRDGRERPSGHADRPGQCPGPAHRQLLDAPGLPGQKASDARRQGDDHHPDQGYRYEKRNRPARARGAQNLDEPLILIGPQYPAGQQNRHECGAHEQEGPRLPLQELTEPAGQGDIAVEEARSRRLAHLLDEHRTGRQ